MVSALIVIAFVEERSLLGEPNPSLPTLVSHQNLDIPPMKSRHNGSDSRFRLKFLPNYGLPELALSEVRVPYANPHKLNPQV